MEINLSKTAHLVGSGCCQGVEIWEIPSGMLRFLLEALYTCLTS